MTTLTPEVTVGQMVAEKPSRARVFEKYGIDYCCGGKLPLATLCAKKGIDPAVVLAELEAADAQASVVDPTDWTQAPLPVLIQHLLDTHHAFLKEAMPRLAYLADKVARVHGDEHPELIDLAQVYHKFRADMEQHLGKEEQVLFPAILRLSEGGDGFVFPIDHPITVMEAEHDDAGRDLEQMRALTGGFLPPESACNSYRALYDGLHELELDTFQHIHKENNILFPRAIALLKEVTGR